jgi:hypothetical protein
MNQLARRLLLGTSRGADSVTNTASSLILSGSSYGELYASCRSESELLVALGNAVGASAAVLAQSLRPLGLLERATLAAIKSVSPARYEEHWRVQTRLFSESVVFIARQLRDLFARSRGLSDHAEYVYRETVRGAGSALAARLGLPQNRADDFAQALSHVVLQHAHFPPRDEGEALVRLVSARGKKLTIQEAVSFVKQLVGDDPLRRTEPWAFVRRWLSLRHEPAWAPAAVSA